MEQANDGAEVSTTVIGVFDDFLQRLIIQNIKLPSLSDECFKKIYFLNIASKAKCDLATGF